MLRWLKGASSGCVFASKMAGSLDMKTLEGGPSDFPPDREFRFSDEVPTLLLFPDITSPIAIAQMISVFRQRPEWSSRLIELGGSDERLHVALEWKTPKGLTSRTMGLAPLPTMPPTRRAPVVSIALWAGGMSNQYFQVGRSKRNWVSLADAGNEFTSQTHEHMWQSSRNSSAEFLVSDHPPERFRDVAFSLPASVLEHLTF